MWQDRNRNQLNGAAMALFVASVAGGFGLTSLVGNRIPLFIGIAVGIYLLTGAQVKEFGRPNDLLDRLRADPAFASVNLGQALDVRRFIGRAPEQVDSFLATIVEPIRQRYAQSNQQSEPLRV